MPLLLSCQQELADGKTKPVTAFFDLKDFFEKELEILQAVQAFEKHLTMDGRSDKVVSDTLNLRKELQLFMDSHINRPAWSDKYAIDSIFQQQQLVQIKYTALDEGLKTRSIHIDFEKGVAIGADIKRLMENPALASSQHLKYHRQKGYSIDTKQSLLFSEPQQLFVEVRFVF